MAHVAKLGLLTEELITVLTGLSVKEDPQRFNTYRESALRSFKYHNNARTNQFEIQSRLEGLEEKFRVYNEDAIADALRQRLDELEIRSTKWTPEILHLLLELSDKPVVKTTPALLDLMQPPKDHVEPQYTWEELAADVPLLRDKRVWMNIDYGAESSDDEVASQDSKDYSSSTETSTISSLNDEDFQRAEDFILPINPQTLYDLQRNQFWGAGKKDTTNPAGGSWLDPKIQPITELQAIREILFMLSGLPTTLFPGATQTPYEAQQGFGLKHASNQVFYELLQDLCQAGNRTTKLRTWAQEPQQIPLLQRFQESTLIRLRQLDHRISDLQRNLVNPTCDTVVSIVQIQQELQPSMDQLLRLASLVDILDTEKHAHAFRCLELLYDEACTSHMAGDRQMYEFMGEIFFDCFQVYLRPMRIWMEKGELMDNDRVFFVSEIRGDVKSAALWQDRYKLRTTSNGKLHAPKFLQALAASKIFNTGKSRVILQHLGDHDVLNAYSLTREPNLGFHDVCQSSTLSLIPFTELFEVAFEEWIQSKHSVASSTLRSHLFNKCGLRTSLDALKDIYFMQDGATTGLLVNTIFEKLNIGSSRWNDRFSLTELAHSTMGTLRGVIADRLGVSFASKKFGDVQRARKTVRSLASLTFTYSLPWPVQLVITKDTIPLYHLVLTFLLQIRRSAYMLERTRMLRDTEDMDCGSDERALYYGIRSRLLWFTSTLYNHLTDLVITNNTVRMHQAMAEADDVDQMIQVHDNYIKHLVEQALLGHKLKPIHKAIITVLDLSIALSDARTAHSVIQSSYRAPLASFQGHSLSQRHLTQNEPESTDEEGDEEFSVLSVVNTELSYIDQLRKIRVQFDHLCKFVSTGLRSVARTSDPGSWDMLAEKLEGSFTAS